MQHFNRTQCLTKSGSAAGVIGPSGAGKSTLARAITGVWRPPGDEIRLDGASLDNYKSDILGHHIGYLPQSLQLFDGMNADNIPLIGIGLTRQSIDGQIGTHGHTHPCLWHCLQIDRVHTPICHPRGRTLYVPDPARSTVDYRRTKVANKH